MPSCLQRDASAGCVRYDGHLHSSNERQPFLQLEDVLEVEDYVFVKDS